MMNLAQIHEAIAEAIPDRDCIVFRDRRLSWADVTDRTRRLAQVFRAHGLGCHTEREKLENFESGQSHVGLYLHNGNEYLEGMLGAFKARCAPFNVNYRYVEEELLYLFDNADAEAVVFHARFAPTLAAVRAKLPKLKLLLQVDDGSGEPLLDGALDYEAALAEAEPVPLGDDLSGDDLYILYTGGTTGMPKGVLWRQEEIFYSALSQGQPESVDVLVERAKSGPGIRALPTAPFMHGAAHWAAFNMWHVGGTVIVHSKPEHLDPDDVWSTVEREKCNTITIVGDAFARPLIDQLKEKEYDLSSLFMVTSGGAIFTAGLKQELLDLLPDIRILDALGSSETGAQASTFATKDGGVQTGSFDMAAGNIVLSEDLSRQLAPGDDETGWLAREGFVPLGYYKDAEKTAKTFPVIGGKRFSVPGDRARVAASGELELLGRDSVTINSGGEKIFAEEVEHALKHHPSVYDCVVCGTPNERWGSQVTAIVQLREGEKPSEDDLKAVANEHVTRYKLPKAFVYVDQITRAPSGKADYRWAKATAYEALGIEG